MNPARSIGPALFAGDGAITQLWLFILAPTVGGLVAGFTYAALLGRTRSRPRCRRPRRPDPAHIFRT